VLGVADLLGRAEVADQADAPDIMSIVEELSRCEGRLAEIARTKVVIEARVKERHARERAKHEAAMAAREAKATGRKPRGRVPQPLQQGRGSEVESLLVIALKWCGPRTTSSSFSQCWAS
jgi:hypothetical protein